MWNQCWFCANVLVVQTRALAPKRQSCFRVRLGNCLHVWFIFKLLCSDSQYLVHRVPPNVWNKYSENRKTWGAGSHWNLASLTEIQRFLHLHYKFAHLLRFSEEGTRYLKLQLFYLKVRIWTNFWLQHWMNVSGQVYDPALLLRETNSSTHWMGRIPEAVCNSMAKWRICDVAAKRSP